MQRGSRRKISVMDPYTMRERIALWGMVAPGLKALPKKTRPKTAVGRKRTVKRTAR